MTRSLKKGPYVPERLLQKIKQQSSKKNKTEVLKTWFRSSVVIPEMVGLTIAVHDGRKFISVFLTENMVGHRLGEFAPTRTFRAHSGQRQAQKGGAAPAPKVSGGDSQSKTSGSPKGKV